MEKQQGDGARWGSTQQRSAADSRHHAVVPMPSFVCSHSAADGRRRKTRAGAKPGDCIPVREPTHRTSQPPPTAAGRSPNPKKHPFSDRLPRRSGDRRAARRRGGSTVTNARFGTVTSITHGTLEMPEARVPSAPRPSSSSSLERTSAKPPARNLCSAWAWLSHRSRRCPVRAYSQEHLRQLDGGAAVLNSDGGESGRGHLGLVNRRVETRVRAAVERGRKRSRWPAFYPTTRFDGKRRRRRGGGAAAGWAREFRRASRQHIGKQSYSYKVVYIKGLSVVILLDYLIIAS